ncbi:MAG: peptide chain release factor N(5)-glutamine methyltransferase [Lachnospiraceae bacterium]|jgi:release factor glutamine methyltransferase|nr:peptide chain release factor N(5)-glutamine methyltransferase [Lachnospiraceae bacterium]
MRYRELLLEGEKALQAAKVPEYELDAWYLFSHCFSMDRGAYFLYMETEIPGERLEAAEEFRRLARQRAERIPLQQILGSQEFMGLSFFVNEQVLIPRQDTETLVETVLAGEKRAVLAAVRPYRLLDLCTGSGCIGLSLAVYLRKNKAASGLRMGGRKEGGGPEILLSDISREALQVAEENIRRFDLKDSCRTVQSDLFTEFSGEQFDCIVSNPPYIPSGVIGTLLPEVKDHEPKIALDGSGDGLAFYRRISREAAEHLFPGGHLYLEIGWDQGETVPKLLGEAGFFQIEVRKDLAGCDRVVKAEWPGV